MKYKEVKQVSRFYEYGEGKEFKTRDEALKMVQRLEANLKTDIAIMRIYEISEVKVIEVEKAFQLVWTVRIPILVEE